MNTYISHLDRIATDIDLYGVASTESAIATVVERARGADVNPVLVAVLSDAAEPEIARARAFGMVAAELATAEHRPSVTLASPALVATF